MGLALPFGPSGSSFFALTIVLGRVFLILLFRTVCVTRSGHMVSFQLRLPDFGVNMSYSL